MFEIKNVSKREFALYIHNELLHNNNPNKIAYSIVKDDGTYSGGLVSDLKEAMNLCYQYGIKKGIQHVSVGDYSSQAVIYDYMSILFYLNKISEDEYNKYVDSIEIED